MGSGIGGSVVELVDTLDLKSNGLNGRAGSSPAAPTRPARGAPSTAGTLRPEGARLIGGPEGTGPLSCYRLTEASEIGEKDLAAYWMPEPDSGNQKRAH